jgi:hypothetical protein
MGLFATLLKTDVTPETASVGGALRPEAANSFIDAVVDQSGLLKRVTLHRMNRLTSDISVMDIANRVLKRVAEGTAPSAGDLPGVSNYGKTLLALPMQLFQSIPFSTLSDNANIPGYETSLATMFAKKFANEIEDLALNGTDDDYSGSAFLELNKGWIALAKAAAGSGDNHTRAVDVNTLGDDYTGKLKTVMDAQDARFDAQSVLLMASADYRGLVEDFASEPGGIAFAVSGMVPTFMGKEIVVSPYMPSGTVLYTPLTNLVYGICRDIERYREVSGTKRCVDYTFNIACDFAIAVNRACVVGYDVG